jgi:hypothetical protein
MFAFNIEINAQTDVYAVTGGELLFQKANISFTDAYTAANPNNVQVGNPMRFTCFFHVGQYVHMDFTNNLGLFTGIALRNVGFISDERLDITNDGIANVSDYKIIRRSYMVGVPLAIKLGSFKDHTFIFAGSEFELNMAFKEKYWNSTERDGSPIKKVNWLGNQTPLLIPSLFAGIQFPGGINVKFKYYLKNFIDNTTTSTNPVFDLKRYEQTQVMYLSLSYHINTKNMTKKGRESSPEKFARL